MSKEEKTLDPQPKIKDEQLQELQKLVGNLQQGQASLGQLEMQKFSILNAVQELDKQLKDIQDKLQEEYGRVSIDISNGAITEIEDEANKED